MTYFFLRVFHYGDYKIIGLKRFLIFIEPTHNFATAESFYCKALGIFSNCSRPVFFSVFFKAVKNGLPPTTLNFYRICVFSFKTFNYLGFISSTREGDTYFSAISNCIFNNLKLLNLGIDAFKIKTYTSILCGQTDSSTPIFPPQFPPTAILRIR